MNAICQAQSKNEVLEERLPKMEEENKILGTTKALLEII